MKKFRALIFILVLIFVLSGSVSALSGTVDQFNEGSGKWWYQIYDLMPIGQEFVPSKPILTGVEVWVQSFNTESEAADITVYIRESAITGTIVTSKTLTAVDPDYDGWLLFEFDSAFVTPGSVYVIEIQSPLETHFLYFNGNTYAAGNSIIKGSQNSQKDLLFRTYAMNVPVAPMAAPDIAAHILQAEGVRPNQSTGKGKDKVQLNLISETARHMGEQTLFDGIEMKITENGTEICNPAYWNAVLTYLNSFGFSFDYTLYDYYIDDQP